MLNNREVNVLCKFLQPLVQCARADKIIHPTSRHFLTQLHNLLVTCIFYSTFIEH